MHLVATALIYILVTKFGFGGNFGIRLSSDLNGVELTPNLEFLNNFWYEFGGSLS